MELKQKKKTSFLDIYKFFFNCAMIRCTVTGILIDINNFYGLKVYFAAVSLKHRKKRVKYCSEPLYGAQWRARWFKHWSKLLA